MEQVTEEAVPDVEVVVATSVTDPMEVGEVIEEGEVELEKEAALDKFPGEEVVENMEVSEIGVVDVDQEVATNVEVVVPVPDEEIEVPTVISPMDIAVLENGVFGGEKSSGREKLLVEVEQEQEVATDVEKVEVDPKTSTPFPNYRSSLAPFSPIPLNFDEEPDNSNNNNVTDCDDVSCTSVNMSIGNLDKCDTTKSKPSFQCELCEYKTSKKSNLKRHKEQLHEVGDKMCEFCQFVTKRTDNLKRHIESKHKVDRRKPTVKESKTVTKGSTILCCDQCDYKTPKKDHLKRHTSSKHSNIHFPCRQCNFTTNRQDNLKRHCLLVHKFI